jgi:hypothetical protein
MFMPTKQDLRVDRILDLQLRRQQLSEEARRSIRLRNIRHNIEEREKMLLLSGLSDESKTRLRAAFPGTDLNGLREAINVERKRQ